MKKIIKSLFVLIISFVIFNGLVIKAETISSGTISIDKPVDNYDLITDCNAGEGQTGFTCSIKKWYKGGSNENPQLDVGLEGKYTPSYRYIAEIAIKATDGNELSENFTPSINGVGNGLFVEVNESGEYIFRFAFTLAHVVHFETYGGSLIPDLIVDDEGYITDEIPNPIKENYVFFGWYDDEEYISKYNFDTDIIEETTIYALFVPDTNIVHNAVLNLDAPIVGRNIVVSEVEEDESIITIQEPLPYAYASSESNYFVTTYKWVRGNCKNGSKLCNQYFAGTILEDTYYYASFYVEAKNGYKLDPYDLNVTVNGDTPEEVFSVVDGSSVRVIAKIMSEKEYVNNNPFIISFDMKDAPSIPSIEVLPGELYDLPGVDDVTPPSGKILNKWISEENEYYPGEEIEINKDYTFEPVWENGYSVTFNLNGKTGSAPKNKYVREGSIISRPTDPSYYGYIFTGWYTEEECNNLFVFETTGIYEDTILYAGWVENTNIYELRLYSNTSKVLEGELTEFEVTTTTEHISIEDFGSNTSWSYREVGFDSWHGFGGEIPTAIYDNSTHYALRLAVHLEDSKSFDSNVKIYFNDEDVTENLYTILDAGFSWGGYLYIDLGTAYSKNALKPEVSITANNNKLTLDWKEQYIVTKYEIQRSTDNKKWTKLATVSTNTYTDKSLTYGKTYYYKVKAYGNGKWSKYSTVVSKKVVPNKVKNLAIKSAGSNNVKLTYDKVSVTGYEIYNSTDNKKWTKVATVSKNTTLEYNVKKLKSNKTYYFKVRAYKTVSGKKIYGSYSSVVSTKTAPVSPEVKLSLKDIETMNLKITATKGATKYVVQKSMDGKTYESLIELKEARTLIQIGQELGVTYYYRVKACNAENRCSAWVSVSLKQTPKTPKLTLSTTSKKVKSVLSKVDGAVGYKLYMATSKNGKYTTIKEFTSEDELLEYTTKTKKGNTYYFKVRSYTVLEDSSKVYSPYSSVKSIKSK